MEKLFEDLERFFQGSFKDRCITYAILIVIGTVILQLMGWPK